MSTFSWISKKDRGHVLARDSPLLSCGWRVFYKRNTWIRSMKNVNEIHDIVFVIREFNSTGSEPSMPQCSASDSFWVSVHEHHGDHRRRWPRAVLQQQSPNLPRTELSCLFTKYNIVDYNIYGALALSPMLDIYFIILITLLRSYYHSLTQEKLRLFVQNCNQSGVCYSKVYVLARKGTKLPIWMEREQAWL